MEIVIEGIPVNLAAVYDIPDRDFAIGFFGFGQTVILDFFVEKVYTGKTNFP